MKRFGALALSCLLLLLGMFVPLRSSAAPVSETSIYVDWKPVTTKYFLQDEQLMVPSLFLKHTGMNVDWNDQYKAVVLWNDDMIVGLPSGKNYADYYLRDTNKWYRDYLPTTTTDLADATYIPLLYAVQKFGMKVTYDAQLRRTYIDTNRDTNRTEQDLLRRAERRPGATPPDYGPLREQVSRFIATRPQTFGIYFKDLQTGATWGLNEREPIHAASTIKVPLVLYVNRQVADGKARMNDRVVYQPEYDWTGGAGILQRDGIPGKGYSLRVLSNLAITISDNVATNMLFRHFGKENVGRFMGELGGEVIFPEGRRITTARDMGLYVEAVLEFARQHPELGERMLDDMGHSIWHVGLPGMLPQDVFVAHKEGEISGVADDVGIVFSERPFVLSILSKGVPDIDQGFEDIARIVKMVYDYQEQLGPVD